MTSAGAQGERSGVELACIQLARLPERRAERLERVRSLLENLGAADLVVLPELWSTGFFRFDRYAKEAEPLDGPITSMLAVAARQLGAYIVGGSFVERAGDGRLFNTAPVIVPDGTVAAIYRKVHVFGYKSKEASLLSAGDRLDAVTTPWGVLGVTTCYDLRFPELYRLLVDRGMEVLVVPSAWPAERVDHWRLLTRARAVENQVFMVACNHAGEDGGAPLAGHSMVIDPWGAVIAEAGDEPAVIRARLDLEGLRRLREEFPALADRRLAVCDPFSSEVVS